MADDKTHPIRLVRPPLNCLALTKCKKFFLLIRKYIKVNKLRRKKGRRRRRRRKKQTIIQKEIARRMNYDQRIK